jgi:hypothetical protein
LIVSVFILFTLFSFVFTVRTHVGCLVYLFFDIYLVEIGIGIFLAVLDGWNLMQF